MLIVFTPQFLEANQRSSHHKTFHLRRNMRDHQSKETRLRRGTSESTLTAQAAIAKEGYRAQSVSRARVVRSVASLHLAGVYKGGDIFRLAIKASEIRCSCSGGPGSLAEKATYLLNLGKGLHQLKMPQFQEQYLGSLLEYIRKGNSQIRHAATDCLAKMLQNQYNTELRNELIAVIKSELSESNSSAMRKAYIYFLKAAVDTFSRVFIINNFLPSYMALSKDKDCRVKIEWVNSLVVVKPFFEGGCSALQRIDDCPQQPSPRHRSNRSRGCLINRRPTTLDEKENKGTGTRCQQKRWRASGIRASTQRQRGYGGGGTQKKG
ncbi:hypothetical protein FGO68_gene11698 [Halteria grandinella]|uniref:Uncharacterized protein n=1 Tax=Halteria grandinella TaxID=5974 RepID=A0A8J8ND79_HALGN|nr:hypothetical protein FGO68_gene11698 [Halteria grandinella]